MICGFEADKSILSHVRNEHAMTAKEYRCKFNNAPLRESWVKSTPEALEAFRKIGRANSALLVGQPGRHSLGDRWSTSFERCIECGTTESPHVGKGICKRCTGKIFQNKKTASKNSLLLQGQENIDFVICQICKKPFESLTTNGHLKMHFVTVQKYKELYPNCETICKKRRTQLGESISAGRRELMKSRGYLNPQSQRDKKRAEMAFRHATSDFCNVSIAEKQFADWLLKNGYTIKVGKDNGISDGQNVVYWQYPLLDKYCVDFFSKEKNICVEILGDWWHGRDYFEGKMKYEFLVPKVKKNIYLDKRRFEDIEKSGIKLVKIWSEDIKKAAFECQVKDIFIKIGDLSGEATSLMAEAILASGETDLNKKIDLSKVVFSPMERFNARWFQSNGLVEIDKQSQITIGDAMRLRKMLLEYGDKTAIPNDVIQKYFAECRSRGFPYDSQDEIQRKNDYDKLVKAYLEKKDGLYNWSGIETRLATSFHPHFYECRRKGKISPIEFFGNDAHLTRGIIKAVSLHGVLTETNLRSICRNEDSVTHINNFPPRVMKAIIKELFPDKNGLTVIDPFAGFSGRIIGCAAAGNVATYSGIDMSQSTIEGLLKTKEFLHRSGCGMNCNIIHGNFIEKFTYIDDADLIIASPPFFDLEEYKDVPVATEYSRWLLDFVSPFMTLCRKKMKKDGRLALYVEPVGEKNLPKDFSDEANKAGLIACEHISFKRSRGSYQRKLEKYKKIDILVFKCN